MCWGRGLWVFSFYGIMVHVQSWEKIAGSQSFLVNSISVYFDSALYVLYVFMSLSLICVAGRRKKRLKITVVKMESFSNCCLFVTCIR